MISDVDNSVFTVRRLIQPSVLHLWLHFVSIVIHIEEKQSLQAVVLVVSLVVSSGSFWVCCP